MSLLASDALVVFPAAITKNISGTAAIADLIVFTEELPQPVPPKLQLIIFISFFFAKLIPSII